MNAMDWSLNGEQSIGYGLIPTFVLLAFVPLPDAQGDGCGLLQRSTGCGDGDGV
jgi:hypothetical protein